MLVVEGCDGVGKSTLVNHLAKKFDLEVGERGVSNRDFLYKVTRQDTYRALSRAVLGKTPATIWDRLFISEFVYADIVGRPCEFGRNEAMLIQDFMEALSFPMIVCLPPFSVVEGNVRAAHQMAGVHDNLRRIYDRYKRGHLPWPENCVWYDYTEQTPHFATLQEVEEEVEGYLEMRRERESWD